MKQFQYTVTDPMGIHARPAGLLVKAAKPLDSTITIIKEGGKSANATKLMAVMGLAIKAGMDPFHALKAITINPAKHGGIDHRVGSIEIGKDADLCVMDGSCFEISTVVKHVFIDGVAQPTQVVYAET